MCEQSEILLEICATRPDFPKITTYALHTVQWKQMYLYINIFGEKLK